MQVIQVDAINGGLVADLVGFAVANAALHATASHPGTKAMRIVIAAWFVTQLCDWQSSKLAAPNHQSIVQQPALLEIGKQCGNRLVGLTGELAVVTFDINVAVPRPLVFHLDVIAKDMNRDFFLTATGAKEYGLVDEITTKPKADEQDDLADEKS